MYSEKLVGPYLLRVRCKWPEAPCEIDPVQAQLAVKFKRKKGIAYCEIINLLQNDSPDCD